MSVIATLSYKPAPGKLPAAIGLVARVGTVARKANPSFTGWLVTHGGDRSLELILTGQFSSMAEALSGYSKTVQDPELMAIMAEGASGQVMAAAPSSSIGGTLPGFDPQMAGPTAVGGTPRGALISAYAATPAVLETLVKVGNSAMPARHGMELGAMVRGIGGVAPQIATSIVICPSLEALGTTLDNLTSDAEYGELAAPIGPSVLGRMVVQEIVF